MKILQYLPSQVATVVSKFSGTVEEIRLRADRAVRIKVGQAWYYIGQNRLQNSKASAIVSSLYDIENVLQGACDKSIYAYEKQLTEGFLTLSDGTRIGVGGTVSSENGVVKCFSSYTSLCIRIPHFVTGFGKEITKHLDDGLKNCLIVGQPASGKTTILREIACILSQNFNVVVVDERGEISLCENFIESSQNVDTLLFSSKNFGITTAVRSLSPEVIVCDELSQADFAAIKLALSNGVAIVCSIHGKDNAVQKMLAENGIAFDLCFGLSKNHTKPPQLFQN